MCTKPSEGCPAPPTMCSHKLMRPLKIRVPTEVCQVRVTCVHALDSLHVGLLVTVRYHELLPTQPAEMERHAGHVDGIRIDQWYQTDMEQRPVIPDPLLPTANYFPLGLCWSHQGCLNGEVFSILNFKPVQRPGDTRGIKTQLFAFCTSRAYCNIGSTDVFDYNSTHTLSCWYVMNINFRRILLPYLAVLTSLSVLCLTSTQSSHASLSATVSVNKFTNSFLSESHPICIIYPLLAPQKMLKLCPFMQMFAFPVMLISWKQGD